MTLQEQIKAVKEQRAAIDAELAKLKEGIPTLKLPKNKRVEVGAKGTINVYGLGKFPVCLYLSQLQNLNSIINSPEFVEFVKQNADKIAVKKEE